MISKLFWGLLSVLTWIACFIAGVFIIAVVAVIVIIIIAIIMLILGAL